MADETGQKDTAGGRKPMDDPRLQAAGGELSALQIAALWAGYAAAALLLVFIFWMAVDSNFTLWQKVLLAVTVGLGVFWGVVHHRTITGAARARGVRIGANSVIFIFFVLGIIVLVNIFAARHHVRRDITEEQLYSLSEQTRAILSDLDRELEFVAFLSDRDPLSGQPNPATTELRDRLREYEMVSPLISVNTYDPVLDAEEASQYNVTSTTGNVVIIEAGDQQEKVYGGNEEQLTSAVLALTTGEQPRVYFLTGHGEFSIEDASGTGLAVMKSILEEQQYQVDELNLATQESPGIPGDCAALVIAGPSEDLREQEIDAIGTYLSQGGNLLVALTADGPTLSALLTDYGVDVRDGTVRDSNAGYEGAAEMPMARVAGQHRIVQNLQGFPIALARPRAIEIIDPEMEDPMAPGMPPPSQQAQALIESYPSARLQLPDAEETGPSGPFTLAAVVDPGQTQQNPMMPDQEQEQDGPRLVIVADAQMMTDQFINQWPEGLGIVGNAYLALNSINWLMENEKLITIPPQEDVPRTLSLTGGQKRLVWAIVVGVIPLLIIIAGFVVWWRRR
ncbi:MAG: GldG family protein [Armatimonadota bacterium]